MKSHETESRITPHSSSTQQEEQEIEVEALEQDVDEEEHAAPDSESEEEVAEERPGRRRFLPPTREQVFLILPFAAIVLVGAVLRFWALGDKPLHHDESLHGYFSLQLLHNLQNWAGCYAPGSSCYRYDPLLHGPFQFHGIALVYQISQWLQVPENGVNTTTVRIMAATLGSLLVGLPFFLRDYLGRTGALIACFLLAVSPSMVYFSRFAREDIYMAFFTLLMIVAVGRYVRDRHMRWLIIAAVAFSLSYATKEATFLSIAIFGSFLGAVLMWELGSKIVLPERTAKNETLARFIPKTGAIFALGIYLIIVGALAKVLFGVLHSLALFIADPKNTGAADGFVQQLKDATVNLIPFIGIALALFVLMLLFFDPVNRSPGLQRFVSDWTDRRQQPLLNTFVTMPWTHWFFALISGWAVFLILFTVIFTNIRNGIGDGIWQGLYYWLKQQQVARGGQPWYYYLLLIPLYEQIGLIFGLVGVVRCLLRPTRFRLFLVYWFVGSVFIYSWAAEKMPWLMIHMTMPMMLLAAIGLAPAVQAIVERVKRFWPSNRYYSAVEEGIPASRRKGVLAGVGAFATVGLAVLLLLPTLQNMFQVTYIHPADAPHEMMVYVQTSTDINIVMSRIQELDQKYYGGQHQIPIGLMDDATWPFAWYLSNYKQVCYSFPTGCSTTAKDIPVIISGGDNVYTAQTQYISQYKFHQYHMRVWWDEGYKPPACKPTLQKPCGPDDVGGGGVGPWLWLSYGNMPPANAQFDLGRAASNVWQWWWQRKAIGSIDGAYDMGLFIRKDLSVSP